jgi:hypothetical protein
MGLNNLLKIINLFMRIVNGGRDNCVCQGHRPSIKPHVLGFIILIEENNLRTFYKHIAKISPFRCAPIEMMPHFKQLMVSCLINLIIGKILISIFRKIAYSKSLHYLAFSSL